MKIIPQQTLDYLENGILKDAFKKDLSHDFIQYHKKGNFDNAYNDFTEILGNGSYIKPGSEEAIKDYGYKATTKGHPSIPDDYNVIVRNKSTQNKPTLEIQNPNIIGNKNKTVIKIRYE